MAVRATITERALAAGRAAFGERWRPAVVASAPGRIELLGNHLDYNGGPVLAAAIDRRVAVVRDEPSGDAAGGVSAVFADVEGHQFESAAPLRLGDWRNPTPPPAPFDYVRGAVAALSARGLPVAGSLRLAIAGDVPIGFGVSSSAALCVALVLALANRRPTDRAIVLAAQDAEHRAGTPCGTMDQSASLAGGVILYDAERMLTTRLDPQLGDLAFAVVDSGVARSLGASSYPVRVRESAEALAVARRAVDPGLPNLAAVTPAQVAKIETTSPAVSPAIIRRLRHVVAETERVRRGTEAMRVGDWAAFGALMTASGRSSATDYEISHPRVEELVAEALTVDGVLGARMMGGGEGGTALTLLRASTLPALEACLRRGYFARYGMADRDGLVQLCRFAPGADTGPLPS